MAARSVAVVCVLSTAISVVGQARDHKGGLLLPHPGLYITYPIETNFRLPDGVRLPKKVDLSAYLPKPGDQAKYGSCTAWAIGYGLMTYQYNKEHGVKPSRKRAPRPADVYSPGFLFRMVKNYVEQDRSKDACVHGVNIFSTLTVACDQGNVKADVVGYEGALGKCAEPVADKPIADALERKLASPIGLQRTFIIDTTTVVGPFDPVQWHYHLSQGDPILVSLFIDCTFMDLVRPKGKTRKKLIWDNPKPVPDDCGTGHALLCCGYDVRDSTFLLYNSFGTAWGDSGFCWVNDRTLRANCLQSFTIAADHEAADPAFLKEAGLPRVKNDHIVIGNITIGESFTVDGVKVVLAEHNRGNVTETALVQLVDPKTRKVLKWAVIDRDVERCIEYNGKLWAFRFEEPDGERYPNKKVYVCLSVKVDADGDEKLKNGIDRHLAPFRERIH